MDSHLKILKTILTDPVKSLQYADCYDETLFPGYCREFASIILSYIKKYRVPPTKRVLLDFYQDEFDICQDIENTFQILDSIDINANEFKYELDKLKEAFKNSKLEEWQQLLSEGSPNIISKLHSEVEKIKQIDTGAKQTFLKKEIKEHVSEFKSDYKSKLEDENFARGIQTGYSHLDQISSGFFPGDLIIIGGETNSGKSLWLNNIAIQVYLQKNNPFLPHQKFSKGYNVLYFSLEMPYKLCFNRTLAKLADVPINSLRDAKLLPQEIKLTNQVLDFVKNYPYHFEIIDIPRGASVRQIEHHIEEAQSKFPVDLVVIDYLTLMDAGSTSESDQDWLRISELAGSVHELARSYNLPILSAVQLTIQQRKAPGKDSDDQIGSFRVARSKGLVSHVNLLIQIESRKNEQSYSDFPYHIVKNRSGELGKHYLMKNFKNATLLDVPYESKIETEDVPINSADISSLLEKYNWNR